MTLLRRAERRTRAMTVAPRVGLVGLLGAGNLGNDGSLEAVLAYLGEEHSDAILDFLCSGTDQLTARYGVPATRLRWYSTETKGAPGMTALAAKSLKVPLGMVIDAFRTASWVRRHDVVIVPGMGVLEATLPLRPWHTPYSMFLVCASGRLFGTKVALVSVGANDIRQRLTRRLITAAARLAYYRSYRDTFSRDAMRRMGLDTSGDAVYPDLAFALPTPRGAPVVAGTVGVGVMDYHGGNDDRQQADQLHASYVEKMKSFVLWLVDNGRPVRLFTTDVHDERIMREVIADLRAHRPELGPSQVIAEPVSSLDELMRQIASVDTVVASRFHNVLCALKLAKPTLSVGYAEKFDVLMAEMGLAEFCQSAHSLDAGRLIEQFTRTRKPVSAAAANDDGAHRGECAASQPPIRYVVRLALPGSRTGGDRSRARACSHRCSRRGIVMNDPAGGESFVSEGNIGNTLHKKDFWSKENLKYSRPHYRLEKAARIINRLARGRRCTLLDVGCGPATLMSLLRSNIQYYGIDIAIHDPAPNLIEADFLETPIRFDDKRFDIILAQGVFEYVGNFQTQKFAEIAGLLNDSGVFVVSYVNFDHRKKYIYEPYSNVQTLNDFRQSLAQHFKIHRFFPTSHNWNHSEPNRKLLKAANMHININVPFISRVLAVEYFFICSARN